MAKRKSFDPSIAGGDVGMMKKLYRAWTRAANERIRVTAPKAGGQAYRHIIEPLEGAPYTKKDKYGNVIFKGLGRNPSDALVREAFAKMSAFMRAKTSTVTGIKEVAEKRRETMEKVLQGLGLGALGEESYRELLEWLGSDEGRIAKQTFDSDLVVMSIQLDITARPGGGSVLERWRAFEESSSTLAGWIRDSESKINGAYSM